MPSSQHADARWLSSHPRIRADGRTVTRAQNTPSSRPSASEAGRTDAVRHARRQEGMRGSGNLRTAPAPRRARPARAHPAAGVAERPKLRMPSCQHADARWLSSHPRIRADGRTVATAPSSWPRGSAAGRTDAVRQARRQEGMRGSGNLRTAPAPRRARPARAHPAASVAARPEPPMPSCQHAHARWLSSHPRIRADGRTVATAPSSWPSGSEAGRTITNGNRPSGRASRR